MADDKKIPELNEATTAVGSTLIPMVTDSTGTAEVKKITPANFFSTLLAVATAWLAEHTAGGGHLTKAISIVQSGQSGIGAQSLVFDFVPSKILLKWSVSASGSNGGNFALSVGTTLIAITGTDSLTQNMNINQIYPNYPATTWNAFNNAVNDTTKCIRFNGGNTNDNGAATCYGVATWTTATKTLAISYTNSYTANQNIDIMAIAFK